jgi:hypothetical protein
MDGRCMGCSQHRHPAARPSSYCRRRKGHPKWARLHTPTTPSRLANLQCQEMTRTAIALAGDAAQSTGGLALPHPKRAEFPDACSNNDLSSRKE